MDLDGDGFIDPQEWAVAQGKEPLRHEQLLTLIDDSFDEIAKGSDYASKEEIVEGHGGDATGILRHLVADGRGLVDYRAWTSFVGMMEREKGAMAAKAFVLQFVGWKAKQEAPRNANLAPSVLSSSANQYPHTPPAASDAALSDSVRKVLLMRKQRRNNASPG